MPQLSAAFRRFALTVHVAVSVGFAGAVAGFLALALVGIGAGGETGQAMYLAMDALTRLVIVPLCFASLVSGVLSSLGTPWGLLRYWWVLVKLVMTVVSTVILVMHLAPIAAMAHAVPGPHTATMQLQLAAAAGAALVALLLMTALSIYKPRGLTPFGANRQASA